MNIKKLLLFILFPVIVFFPSFTSQAHAQEQLLFAVIPYQTREDMDFFFAHSVHPLDYLEGEDIKVTVFLAIITPQQKEELVKAGYKPTIVDEHAGRITQYYLLEYPRPNESYKVKGFDVAYPLTERLTLIKLPPDKEFVDVQTGVLTQFFPKQYTTDLVPPPLRTKNSLTPSPTPGPLPAKSAGPLRLGLFIVVIALPLLLVVGYIAYKKRKNGQSTTNNSPENPV